MTSTTTGRVVGVAGSGNGSGGSTTGGSVTLGSGVMVTATKLGGSATDVPPTFIRSRQRYNRLSCTPNRRAASVTTTPGRNASSTIRTFSADV